MFVIYCSNIYNETKKKKSLRMILINPLLLFSFDAIQHSSFSVIRLSILFEILEFFYVLFSFLEQALMG